MKKYIVLILSLLAVNGFAHSQQNGTRGEYVLNELSSSLKTVKDILVGQQNGEINASTARILLDQNVVSISSVFTTCEVLRQQQGLASDYCARARETVSENLNEAFQAGEIDETLKEAALTALNEGYKKSAAGTGIARDGIGQR